MNLLLNAIYFTPEGGSICITTSLDRAGRIRLTVQDTGAGIPAQLLGKIFDPFFTTKPVGEGTGLGLTISHRIVEEHRGTIEVESQPGKGTAFIIALPSIEMGDRKD
jgi:signal transduction histidine kinase